MRLPIRISVLFFIGLFAVGSTALGYYYYYVYSPPLQAADNFMRAMERDDLAELRHVNVMSVGLDSGQLRESGNEELKVLLAEGFQRGRILDQRKREGKSRDYYYLVYREPDGQIYALVVTPVGEGFRVVIPERAMSTRH